MTPADQTKAFSEGCLGGVTLLNHGADRIAGQCMSGAVDAAWREKRRGWEIFSNLSGGSSRYNTDSHVDVTDLSLLVGTASYAIVPCFEIIASFARIRRGRSKAIHGCLTRKISRHHILHFCCGIITI